jgi:hypothetical protein
MPAVENSLGPCRKPKSTISGWTLDMRNKKTHRKAQKHKGNEYETDREESDGCYVRIGLIVGDVS